MVSSRRCIEVVTWTLLLITTSLLCGTAKILYPSSDKIVEGAAPRHEHPYIVSIQYLFFRHARKPMYRSICGGAILDNRTILTAAHCFHHEPPECWDDNYCYRIVAGAHDLLLNEPQEQIVPIPLSAITKHESYDGFRYDFDIALIHLPTELKLNEFVQSVELVYPDRPYKMEDAVIAGWGKPFTRGYYLNGSYVTDVTVLRESRVDIYSNQVCRRQWGTYFHQRGMLCGGSHTELQTGVPEVCPGKLGGVLVAKDAGYSEINYVVGIITWRYDCVLANHPALYTKIQTYLPWIEEMREHN